MSRVPSSKDGDYPRAFIPRRLELDLEWTESRSPSGTTRYERAALRWLEPFINEKLPPVTEVALAASALAELRHGERNTGVEALKRLLRHGFGTSRSSRRGTGCSPTCSEPRASWRIRRALAADLSDRDLGRLRLPLYQAGSWAQVPREARNRGSRCLRRCGVKRCGVSGRYSRSPEAEAGRALSASLSAAT